MASCTCRRLLILVALVSQNGPRQPVCIGAPAGATAGPAAALTPAELLSRAHCIAVLTKDSAIEKIAERKGRLSIRGKPHDGTWFVITHIVEKSLKGKIPDGSIVKLQYFVAASASSRAVLTDSRCMVFLEVSEGGIPGVHDFLWLVRDDKNHLSRLPIPEGVEIPDERLDLSQKLLYFVQQSLYSYENEFFWPALTWLRLAIADLRFRDEVLRILENAPRKVDQKFFYEVLALRINNGDRAVIKEIIKEEYYEGNPLGSQILGSAITALQERQMIFSYAPDLLNTSSSSLREGFAAALGQRFKGVNRKIAVNLLMRLIDDPEAAVSARSLKSLSSKFGSRKRRNGQTIMSSGAEQQECVQAWRSWWLLNKHEYVVSPAVIKRFPGLEEVFSTD